MNTVIRSYVFRKLKASSLVEVTVAATLFVLVSSSALLLYLQITRSTASLQRLRWQMWLESYVKETLQNRLYQDQILLIETGQAERKISTYRNNPRLLLVECTLTFGNDRAEKSDKIIHRCIVVNPMMK